MKVKLTALVCVIILLVGVIVQSYLNGKFILFSLNFENLEEYYISKLGEYENLNDMPDFAINDCIQYIANSYVMQDSSYIKDNPQFFTDECYETIINSIENVKPIGITVPDTDNVNYISSINIEKSYSFFELIILCNFVLEHPKADFCGVYLFEIYCNSNGQIRGCNIWQH